MSDNDIEVKVGAESSGVKEGMSSAADAVKEGVAQMGEAFDGLGEMLEGVMSHFMAFAALLAGGAIFREGINTTKELTEQTQMLSRAMGISMEDASTLNGALKGVGSSAEIYTEANAKLTRQVRTNEEAVNKMGVATRGANGQLLDGKTIMTNALGALASYKEGTDRNLAGQQLFGRGAQEVTQLLRLNSKGMDEAKESAEALGLVMGPDQEARTQAYKDSIIKVNEVLEALENQIGQAVMPALTDIGNWFASIGPGLVQGFKASMELLADAFDMVIDVVKQLWGIVRQVFTAVGELITSVSGQEVPEALQIWKNAMGLVLTATLGLKLGVTLAFEAIRAAIQIAVSEVERWAEVANAAFHMDWAGATAAFQSGVGRIEKILHDSQARMVAAATDTNVQMQHALMGERVGGARPTPEVTEIPKGSRSYQNPKTKNNSDELKAQFAVIKATLEGELAVQQEYLKESAQAYTDAYKHNKISLEEFYADKLKTEEAGLAASINIKKEEIRETEALAKQATKPSDQLALKAQEIKLTAQLTVLQAQQANAAIQNSRELSNAQTVQINQLENIKRLSTLQATSSGVDMDKIKAGQQLALRQITDAQMLQEEKGFEDRMYAAKLAAAQRELDLIDNDPIKRAQINAQIEEMERTHQQAMAQIDSDIAVESQKNIIAAQDAIESSFESVFDKILSGSESAKKAFKDLATSILSDLAKLEAKNLTQSLFGSLTGAVGQGGNSTGWLGSLIGAVGGGGGGGGGGDGLDALIGSLASYDVGTSYVPNDGLAMIHKGERIVTAKDNANGKYGGGGGINNFNFTTPSVPDRRSQAQIATAAAQGASLAQRRNS